MVASAVCLTTTMVPDGATIVLRLPCADSMPSQVYGKQKE
jgi:hypothetical protein